MDFKDVITALYEMPKCKMEMAIEKISSECLRGHINVEALKDELEADYLNSSLDYYFGLTEEAPEYLLDLFIEKWGIFPLIKECKWFQITEEMYTGLV